MREREKERERHGEKAQLISYSAILISVSVSYSAFLFVSFALFAHICFVVSELKKLDYQLLQASTNKFSYFNQTTATTSEIQGTSLEPSCKPELVFA